MPEIRWGDIRDGDTVNITAGQDVTEYVVYERETGLLDEQTTLECRTADGTPLADHLRSRYSDPPSDEHIEQQVSDSIADLAYMRAVANEGPEWFRGRGQEVVRILADYTDEMAVLTAHSESAADVSRHVADVIPGVRDKLTAVSQELVSADGILEPFTTVLNQLGEAGVLDEYVETYEAMATFVDLVEDMPEELTRFADGVATFNDPDHSLNVATPSVAEVIDFFESVDDVQEYDWTVITEYYIPPVEDYLADYDSGSPAVLGDEEYYPPDPAQNLGGIVGSYHTALSAMKDFEQYFEDVQTAAFDAGRAATDIDLGVGVKLGKAMTAVAGLAGAIAQGIAELREPLDEVNLEFGKFYRGVFGETNSLIRTYDLEPIWERHRRFG